MGKSAVGRRRFSPRCEPLPQVAKLTTAGGCCGTRARPSLALIPLASPCPIVYNDATISERGGGEGAVR